MDRGRGDGAAPNYGCPGQGTLGTRYSRPKQRRRGKGRDSNASLRG
jgi:hypothetical protein